MHLRAITRLFGILLMVFSLSFLPSILVSLYYADGQWSTFLSSFLITAAAGLLMWLPNIDYRSELSIRDGFLMVTLFWALLSATGALPFIISLHMDFTDSIFESVSGFTTTGATVIVGLDKMPRSILYHRQQIQWLGGMGIIVLAVAILPLLGVGGMKLYRAEASGVAKYEKLTPRIAETARVLWFIYTALTVCCGLAYWLAGMKPFDAICHAYTTIATGGFSTHDASIGFYNNQWIEIIAIIFMLAGGINFAIHFFAWRDKSLLAYINDVEVRSYLGIFLFATILIAISLAVIGTYNNSLTSFRYAAFQVASVLSSTGYGTATYGQWPLHIPMVMAILAFIGGCGGSTAGGIKVLRIILLVKLGIQQLFHLVHPRAVTVVKLGNRLVSEDVLFSVWGFYVLYVITALLLTVLMMASGLNLESAFGAVLSTITLLGPGLGDVASNFASVNDVTKWLAIFAMLVGRLEVFTLLILFLPAFWRN